MQKRLIGDYICEYEEAEPHMPFDGFLKFCLKDMAVDGELPENSAFAVIHSDFSIERCLELLAEAKLFTIATETDVNTLQELLKYKSLWPKKQNLPE